VALWGLNQRRIIEARDGPRHERGAEGLGVDFQSARCISEVGAS
jgi:hypothetical protein